MIVLINGVDRSSSVLVEGRSIAWSANSRATARFVLKDTAPGSIRPIIPQEVEIFSGATRLFGGSIARYREVKSPGSSRLYYEVECVDHAATLDHHIVAQSYDNKTIKEIVDDILANWIVGEGFTSTNTQTGPIITKAVFNYLTASKCFDELSELTGYSWRIDENKDINFTAQGTKTAPFEITSANAINLNVERTLGAYRNTQYIRAGRDLTSDQTESFKGDGTRKVFNVAYPVAMAPTITVNGSPRTVGIRGLETGFQFYWNKDTTEISQDTGGAALTASDTLVVVYRGFFPIIVVSDDAVQIASMASIHGGTGKFESIENYNDIESSDLALDRASGLLRRFATIPMRVNFSVDAAGLRPGQLVTIQITEHGLSGGYLIDSVSADWLSGVGWRYNIVALSGESVGGWAEFFKKMAEAGRQFVIRENEVLIRLLTFTDQVTFTDTLSASAAAPEYRIGFKQIGFSQIA